MQQIFNLLINMIIIELSSTNKFSEIFHFAENNNRIDLDTKAFFENELTFVTANRILINKFVNYLLVQRDNSNYENYALWSIIYDELENWIKSHLDQLNLKIWNDLRNFCYNYWKEVVWDSDFAMIETTIDEWKTAEQERKKT
jgi:hypothetical protein